MVSRTGDRNPRYARGKPHQEIQSEILTCGFQGSHTETDNQKIPIVLNDYRDFLVSHSKPILNRKPPFDASIIPYCRHIKKEPTCRTDFSVAQIGSMNFQRYFFPLDGGGFF